MPLEKLSKILLVVWVISSSAGCGHGPKIDTCQSDPALYGMDCVTPKKSTYFLNFNQTKNFQCLSPEDTRTLLSFCKTNDGSGSTKLKVTFCSSDPEIQGMDCVTPELAEFFLPYSQTENFTCMSLEDARTLLEFCKTNGSPPKNLVGGIAHAQCQGPQTR